MEGGACTRTRMQVMRVHRDPEEEGGALATIAAIWKATEETSGAGGPPNSETDTGHRCSAWIVKIRSHYYPWDIIIKIIIIDVMTQ